MGRSYKNRRKLTGVSEEKEQKKIRDNILKVLKARSSSPGQGGALLVAEPVNTDKSKNRNTRRRRHKAVYVNTSTDESSDGSPRSMKGRGRKRTKSVSLSRRSRKSTKERKELQVEKDTAVSKHLRVAHGITGQQFSMKKEDQSRPNMYTSSRITQKVGLISTGRKGAPACRGIIVPEHISRQTEEEVRKMSAEAEAEVHFSGDVDAAERLVLGSGGSSDRRMLTPASVDRKPLSACNSVESSRNRQSQCGVDSGKFPEKLPVKDTVAGLMTSLKFVTKSLYPGRDYLKETKDELLKLVKQNAPRNATPTRLPVFNRITNSGSVQRSLVQSFTSEDSENISSFGNRKAAEKLADKSCRNDGKVDIQNGHTYSFNDHISLVPKINFADRNPFKLIQVDKDASHFRKRFLPVNSLSSLKRTRELTNNREEHRGNHDVDPCDIAKGLDGLSNFHYNKELLEQNKELLEQSRKKIQNEIRTFYESHKHETNKTGNCGVLDVHDCFGDLNGQGSRKKLTDDYFFSGNGNVFGTPKSLDLASRRKLVIPTSPVLNWDPASMLQTNDEVSQISGNRDIFEPMEIDAKEAEAVNLLEQNDLLKARAEQQKFEHLERSRNAVDNLRTLEWVDQQCRSQCSYCSQESSDHSSHLQVPTREPNFMPSFHGYYADHMATGDLSWQQKNQRVRVEAMDILDHVDQCLGRSSYMDCRGDRTSSFCAVSSDLGTPPVWQAADYSLHRRALLPTSPKSPDGPKFYPKKMY